MSKTYTKVFYVERLPDGSPLPETLPEGLASWADLKTVEFEVKTSCSYYPYREATLLDPAEGGEVEDFEYVAPNGIVLSQSEEDNARQELLDHASEAEVDAKAAYADFRYDQERDRRMGL